MTMTSQHFQFIAEVLADANDTLTPAARSILAREFARRLAETNPNFDRARFLEACGVSEN